MKILQSQLEQMKVSLGGTSGLKPKAEVTPKVTLTKTSIVKSSPFLISRHHLDDAQMKQALRYDQSESTCRIPRSYSYKGERMTYQHSKLGPAPSHDPTRHHQLQTHCDDYFPSRPLASKQNSTRLRQINKHTDLQMPYFRDSRREQRSSTIAENAAAALHLKQQQALVQRIKENEEYGLKQMHKARRHLQKQAKKLRKAYKEKIEEAPVVNQEVMRLEEEIRGLKIRALQLQKNKLLQELDVKIKKTQPISHTESAEKIRYNLNYLLLNKPKYKQPLSRGQDTDSSFSSLELS